MKMTAKEIADKTERSIAWVYRMRKDGGLALEGRMIDTADYAAYMLRRAFDARRRGREAADQKIDKAGQISFTRAQRDSELKAMADKLRKDAERDVKAGERDARAFENQAAALGEL